MSLLRVAVAFGLTLSATLSTAPALAQHHDRGGHGWHGGPRGHGAGGYHRGPRWHGRRCTVRWHHGHRIRRCW